MLSGSIIALSWLPSCLALCPPGPCGPCLAGTDDRARHSTLLLFLAGSVLHLGLGDTEDGLLPDRVPRWLGIVGVSRTSA